MNQASDRQGLARWVAGNRSKWVTLFIWVAVVAVLSIVWPGVNKEENNNAANLSASKPSVQAEAVAAREYPSGAGVPALLVWKRDGGMQDADIQHVQQLFGELESSPLPSQTFVPPLHKLPLPAMKQQLSEDKSALITPVFFDKAADTDALKESIAKLQQRSAGQFGGTDPFQAKLDDAGAISARVTGPVGIQVDAVGLFKNADVSLLIGTVLLVLVILLLIYRSPTLALIPIVAVGFAYGAVSPILGFMAHKGWITVDGQAISIMTVLLFGAGTDYCLFLIARFRQLLGEYADKGKALRKALTGTMGAIAMSGFTVVLALFALLLAQYGAYERFAVPFSISILIMGIASLTLVPALLAIIGRASFYPFVPRTPEMIKERALKKGKPVPDVKKPSPGKLGALVVRRPWTVVVATIAVLGILAGVSSQIKFTYDLLSSFPKDMASREGFSVIEKQFSPGQLAPVKLMVDAQGKETGLGDQLAALPYVASVSKPQAGRENNQIQAYDVELKMNPYSMEAMDRIPDLRLLAEQALNSAGIGTPAEKVWIGGQTSTQYDTKTTTDRDTSVIIPIVIGMIALLLLAYLRSIVAMFYLVASVILSFFSALGLGWLILHNFMGADAIQGAIPLYAFVFLVALGEDYNIFMISSIWSKSRRMPLRQAIAGGVNETGSVITSAGIILAGTFAVLATLPIQVLVQFGVITAIGVLLDTFIVRPLLVPALTALLGRWSFWPGAYRPVEAEEPIEAANANK